ncbi:MAG: hypothetical protein ABJH20_00180 [Rhizobiaceae bacterium]
MQTHASTALINRITTALVACMLVFAGLFSVHAQEEAKPENEQIYDPDHPTYYGSSIPDVDATRLFLRARNALDNCQDKVFLQTLQSLRQLKNDIEFALRAVPFDSGFRGPDSRDLNRTSAYLFIEDVITDLLIEWRRQKACRQVDLGDDLPRKGQSSITDQFDSSTIMPHKAARTSADNKYPPSKDQQSNHHPMTENGGRGSYERLFNADHPGFYKSATKSPEILARLNRAIRALIECSEPQFTAELGSLAQTRDRLREVLGVDLPEFRVDLRIRKTRIDNSIVADKSIDDLLSEWQVRTTCGGAENGRLAEMLADHTAKMKKLFSDHAGRRASAPDLTLANTDSATSTDQAPDKPSWLGIWHWSPDVRVSIGGKGIPFGYWPMDGGDDGSIWKIEGGLVSPNEFYGTWVNRKVEDHPIIHRRKLRLSPKGRWIFWQGKENGWRAWSPWAGRTAKISKKTKPFDLMGQIETPNGVPLLGIQVSLSGPGGARKEVSNEFGWVEFPDLVNGEYMVTLQNSQRPEETKVVTVTYTHAPKPVRQPHSAIKWARFVYPVGEKLAHISATPDNEAAPEDKGQGDETEPERQILNSLCNDQSENHSVVSTDFHRQRAIELQNEANALIQEAAAQFDLFKQWLDRATEASAQDDDTTAALYRDKADTHNARMIELQEHAARRMQLARDELKKSAEALRRNANRTFNSVAIDCPGLGPKLAVDESAKRIAEGLASQLAEGRGICGPDVTDLVLGSLKEVYTDKWSRWTPDYREAICESFVTFPLALSSWDINGFAPSAFDQIIPEEDWKPTRQFPTYDEYKYGQPFFFEKFAASCAKPRRSVCRKTVTFLGQCHHGQVANYVLWGFAKALCPNLRREMDGFHQMRNYLKGASFTTRGSQNALVDVGEEFGRLVKTQSDGPATRQALSGLMRQLAGSTDRRYSGLSLRPESTCSLTCTQTDDEKREMSKSGWGTTFGNVEPNVEALKAIAPGVLWGLLD